MKSFTLLFLILPALVFTQTYIPITNNMVISSNSDIKFMPGNYIFTDPGLDGVIKVSNVHDVILDGDSCTVDGVNYTGYMIKINNSHHINHQKPLIRFFSTNMPFTLPIPDHITISSVIFKEQG